MLGGRHDHPTFDARALIRHLLNQRPKVGVQKDVLIFCVVDNVNNLLGKQAWINSVAHIPSTSRGVVRLKVPIVIPRKRRNTVAARQTPRVHSPSFGRSDDRRDHGR